MIANKDNVTRCVVIAKKADRAGYAYGIAVEPNRRLHVNHVAASL